MATYQEYEQLQAFARNDGAWVGLIWAVSFVCAMHTATHPLLYLTAIAIGAMSLVFAALRLKRFRDEILDGTITFRKALGYSIITYFYASLLFAMLQYLYFQFLDHGQFVQQQLAMLADPQAQEMMRTYYGLTETDIAFVTNNIGALTPIKIAMQFFTLNVMMGAFISFPVAVLMRRKVQKYHFKH